MKIKFIPLITLLFIGNASAFVTYEEQPAPKPYVPPAQQAEPSGNFGSQQKRSTEKEASGLMCKNGIMNIGSDFESEVINSRGQGNFLSAAKQIAPKDWKIVEKSQPKTNRKAYQIGWEESGQWQDILAKIAEKANGCAFVNWDMKVIIISMNEESPTSNMAVDGSTSQRNDAPKSSGQMIAMPVEAPAIVAPYKDPEANNLLLTNKHWVLEPGKTLRANLIDWGKKSGWNVLWKVDNVDFNITHRAVITGTFIEAIDTTMKAYSESQNPLAANTYEQGRVVEIINYTPFKRNVAEQP